ncbi:hypothetical protein A2U01_0000654 [Trifolium medium]|uniref:Uncharacterized protein n=1 Tax=Trifolium medium TaxID=97028 RepID=A0A392LY60_9FABA|nr:hypothetical protein [Trifolium medium]
MFIDSVWGLKERYYIVKPITPSATDSLYKTEVVTEEDGSVRLDANGLPVTRRVTRFPLKWSKKHFAVSTDSYLTKNEALSNDERVDLAKLQSYVDKLLPTRYVTKTGEPALNSKREPRVEARHINTKALLECGSKADRKMLLDNMVDFADELIKIVADQKVPKKGKKKVKSRASAVVEQSAAGGSSSPGGVSSSQAGAQSGSPVVVKLPPPKRQRDEQVIDVDALEKPFLLPRCFSSRDFMDKRPPMVADVERSIIMDMGPVALQEELAQGAAAVMRLLETALVLNDEQGSSTRGLEKLKMENGRLKAEVLKLENVLIGHRGKHEVYVAQAKELKEMNTALGNTEKDLEDLKATHVEKKKKLDDEVDNLKTVMAPVEGELASVQGKTTRAELVNVIKDLGEKVVSGVTYGFENAVAQMKVANSGLELSTEGIGVLKRVENKVIIIPDKYRQMEIDDEEEEEAEEEDNGEDGHEEGHGESDG